MKGNFLFSLVLFSLLACDVTEQVDPDYASYQPLEVGNYRIYEIDSVLYSSFSEESDTFHFYQKEVIESAFIDNEGDSSFRVAVYTKDLIDQAYKFKMNYMVKKNKYTFETNIRNVRLIKLVFPVKELKSWDENELNTEDPQLNRYRNVGSAYTINGINYSNTLEVDGGFIKDPILHFYKSSIYAYGIGLIYSEDIYKETQSEKIEGYEFKKVLIDYGS
ncbi:hypothetical protein GYB22_05955 [bacterium]|nr:hypothetical protein [bacterium]